MFGFRNFKIFLRSSQFSKDLILNCICEYKDFLSVDVLENKRGFVLECRLKDSSLDLRSVGVDFLEFLEVNAFKK